MANKKYIMIVGISFDDQPERERSDRRTREESDGTNRERHRHSFPPLSEIRKTIIVLAGVGLMVWLLWFDPHRAAGIVFDALELAKGRIEDIFNIERESASINHVNEVKIIYASSAIRSAAGSVSASQSYER